MKNNFSPDVKETISLSLEEAMRLESDYIGTPHLLLGLIKQGHNMAVNILKGSQIELPALKKEIEEGIRAEGKKERERPGKTRLFRFFHRPRRGLFLDRQAERVIREDTLKNTETFSEHFIESV
jgi:ATP-dependent Clp protease ATP-binding subunit ClpA